MAETSFKPTPSPTGAPAKIKLTRDFTNSVFSRGFMVIAAFMITVITARHLGPTGRGQYVLAAAFFEVMCISFNFGVGQANTFFVGRQVPVKTVFANSVLITAITGLPASMLVVAFSNPLSAALSGLRPRFILVIALVIPARLLLFCLQHIILGQNDVRGYNRLRNLEVAIQLGLLVMLALGLKAGVWGAIISLLGASLAALAFALIKLHKYFSLAVDFPQLRKSLAYGIKAYVAEMTQFLNFRLDLFLVAFFLNLTQVGYYSIAVSLAQVLWNLPFALGTVLFSKSASSTSESMNEITPRACRTMLFVVLCLAVPLAIFGERAVSIFGTYAPAALPLKLLLPGMLAFTLHQILYTDLAGRGRPEVGTMASIIALIFTIALDLLLIPAYGAPGAALASSLAYGAGATYIVMKFTALTGTAVKNLLLPAPGDFKQAWSAFTRPAPAASLGGETDG